MAAKRTHELIPLAHPLALTSVAVDIEPDTDLPGLRVRATAKVAGKTGVEMEALTAVSVACLTVYDMAKAVDRGMAITGIRLIEKRGGKSGTWTRQGGTPMTPARSRRRGHRPHHRRRRPGVVPSMWRWPRPPAARWPSRSRRGAPSRPSMPPRWTATPCAPPIPPTCRPP